MVSKIIFNMVISHYGTVRMLHRSISRGTVVPLTFFALHLYVVSSDAQNESKTVTNP